MPNWCNNTLNVFGDEKSVASFLAAARGRHAGYNKAHLRSGSLDGEWPAHDDVRAKAAVKTPAPLYGDEVDLCMNALYPIPYDYRRFPFDDNQARKLGEIVDEPRKHGGYQWQCDHWGSKWDVNGELLENHGTSLRYQFESPWSPPILFFMKVAKDFPDLTFELEYYEEGMGFAGRNTFRGDNWNETELPIEDFVEDWGEE